MPYIPDNYDLFKEHEREQERRLRRRPVCHECCERIQSDFCFEINDELICEDCLDTNHKRSTENYGW